MRPRVACTCTAFHSRETLRREELHAVQQFALDSHYVRRHDIRNRKNSSYHAAAVDSEFIKALVLIFAIPNGLRQRLRSTEEI